MMGRPGLVPTRERSPLASLVASLLVAVPLAAGACTNTSNNARPGRVVDAGTDADPRGTPYLWYAGGALNAFSRAQTLSSNDDGPAFEVVPDLAVHNCHDLVFDGAGNLWTIPIHGDEIVRLPAARLTELAPVIPDLVLTSSALAGPQSLIFDAAGNLWVLNFNGAGPSVANVVRFDDPRGLSGNQVVSPSLKIAPGPAPEDLARFGQATAIAFDASGNLWLSAVANALRFDHAGDLLGEVAPAPSAIVSTGEAYGSLAFDAAGDLWLTAARDGAELALRFADPGHLTGAVTPQPVARVRLPSSTATFAAGMGFDADGALWIATSAALLKLAHADRLAGDTSPAAAVVLGQAAFPDLASKVVVRAP
jgi:sugar lactone lactonase YvrE